MNAWLSDSVGRVIFQLLRTVSITVVLMLACTSLFFFDQSELSDKIKTITRGHHRSVVISRLGEPGDRDKLTKGYLVPDNTLEELESPQEDYWTDGSNAYVIRYYAVDGQLFVLSVQRLIPHRPHRTLTQRILDLFW